MNVSIKYAGKFAGALAAALLLGSALVPAQASIGSMDSQNHAAPLPDGSYMVARGGGMRGGGGMRAGGGGHMAANRGGGGQRNFNSGGNRNVRASANSNISGNRNVNRNVNRNTNVNVNRNIDVHNDWHGGDYGHWDDHYYHPVATAAAVTAAAVVTSAVVGSIVYSVPPSCSTVVVNGISYSQCGSTWYQPRYAGSSVQYVVVNSPR